MSLDLDCPTQTLTEKEAVDLAFHIGINYTLIKGIDRGGRGVYFSVYKNMAKHQAGEKKLLKGDKKRGEMHIFSRLCKKYAYFSPN